MINLITPVIAIIGLAWLIAYLIDLLDFITKIVDRIRIFIFQNKTLVDMFFLLLYALLQLVFIIMVTKESINFNLIVTMFVLFLLTLMGIERLCLKSRYNFLNDQMTNIYSTYLLNEADYRRAIDREKGLIKLIREQEKEIEKGKKKGLYINKSFDKQKGGKKNE